MNNEYLTVQEFAEAAGVSKQTIYKQMNSRLAPYVQTIKGQKKIAATALHEFYDTVEQPKSTENKLDSTEKNSETTENQPDSTTENQPDSTESQKQTSLEERIDELEKLLKRQIEEDRQEKEFLKDQIRQKDKTIENLTENLKIAQQLAAADKKKLLEIEQKQQEKEQSIVVEDQTRDVINPAADQEQGQGEQAAADQEEAAKQQKGLKGFFRRLFG